MSIEFVTKLTKALDANDFATASLFIANDCIYEIGSQYIVGRDKIIALYKENADWARTSIDDVVFESQVDAEGDGFLVNYTDKITHKGMKHIYRCQQLLSFNKQGYVNKILHREIPGEKESLEAFETKAGIIRPKHTAKRDDLLTISAIFKNAGIEFALGGSGLMYAIGLTQEVHDWDLTTDEPWSKIEPLLKGFDYQYLEADEFYATTYRCKFKVGSSNIDLMGHFSIKTQAGIHHVPTTVTQHWQGVPLGDPEAWAHAYKLMGRSEKSKLLFDWVRSNNTKCESRLQ
jgi:hypothetical protein